MSLHHRHVDVAATVAGPGAAAFMWATDIAQTLTIWLGLFTAAASAIWWVRRYWKAWRASGRTSGSARS